MTLKTRKKRQNGQRPRRGQPAITPSPTFVGEESKKAIAPYITGDRGAGRGKEGEEPEEKDDSIEGPEGRARPL